MLFCCEGEYDCAGACGGKGLIADKFSKSSITNYKLYDKPLRCKKCNEEAQRLEQNISNNDAKDNSISSMSDSTQNQKEDIILHLCSACLQSLATDSFNKNQLNKGVGRQRCKHCVLLAEAATSNAIEEEKAKRFAQAEERLRIAEESKNVSEILAATSALAALEAQAVTGMKPIIMGGRGGKGGKGRGRGCWERT